MASSYERHLGDLLNRERGRVRSKGGCSAVLIYPNRYSIGMSNLGFLSVFREAATVPGVRVERAFLPETHHIDSLKAAGKPVLTIESARRLTAADILLFSVSFENDYLNLLAILFLSGMPLRSASRDGRHPLIGAGGAAIQINPETIAPFIDFFALGEGEGLTADILTVVREKGGKRGEKGDVLEGLSEIEGIYVPARFEAAYDDRGMLASFVNTAGGENRVTARKAADLAGMSLCSPIVSPDAEFADMLLVEVERGCPFGCAFCVASALYAPVRMRPGEDILADMEKGGELSGTVGLIGPAVSSHPGLVRILENIRDREGAVGLPSIRTELLTDEGIGLLSDLSVRTLTIAPETGSQRLRSIIGKTMSDDEILSLAGRAAAAGIMSVRLYFMVGMPGETPEDVDAIADLAKRVRHTVIAATKGTGRAGRITVSLTPLVPKPHTPLMWMPMEETKVLMNKIRRVQSVIRAVGGISVVFETPKWSYVQALLSRGDRRVADILERATVSGGDFWAAVRQTPVNPDFYVLRRRDEDELFPWDFIDHGLSKAGLFSRYKKITAAVIRE